MFLEPNLMNFIDYVERELKNLALDNVQFLDTGKTGKYFQEALDMLSNDWYSKVNEKLDLHYTDNEEWLREHIVYKGYFEYVKKLKR